MKEKDRWISKLPYAMVVLPVVGILINYMIWYTWFLKWQVDYLLYYQISTIVIYIKLMKDIEEQSTSFEIKLHEVQSD